VCVVRLAYLVGRYPAISHTFIMREVFALRELGVDVSCFSIWATAQEELISAAERDEAARTHALLPPRPLEWARAHLAALRRSPGRYGAVLGSALRLSPSTPRGFALGVLWFLESVVLWHGCRRAGIRHVHVHLGGTAPAVALLACRLGEDGHEGLRSYSMTVHGPMEFYDVYQEALAEKVRGARFVACISDFARSQLMGLVDESHWDKLHVVHCGVDPAVFDSRPERLPDGELSVLCVGRLVQVKGQSMLLEAIAELQRRGVSAHATFVGDGPKRAALEARAAELGVSERTVFTGSVSQERIRDRYAQADVFALASFAEGVPVVLMEAMAMGIPVVASSIMGVGELVEHEQNGLLVSPGRVDQLTDAMERLAADGELRTRLGEQGRAKVQEQFDVATSARRLKRLFAAVEIVDGSKESSAGERSPVRTLSSRTRAS
jgi:glycosyltransferase involved in cell wall biosynthesis